MSRTVEQRDLDRQALLDTLAEHGRMVTKELIGTAQGVTGVEINRIYAQAYADLAWLKRAGAVDSEYCYADPDTGRRNTNGRTTWWLVADRVDVDEEADRREVDRMMAGWEVA